jgi:hypothetical protein
MNYFSVLIEPDISFSKRRLLLGHILFVENRIVRDFHVITELGVQV